MTGPDAALVWIALGCIAVVAILSAIIALAASLADGASDDALDEQSGADWGGEHIHNGEVF